MSLKTVARHFDRPARHAGHPAEELKLHLHQREFVGGSAASCLPTVDPRLRVLKTEPKTYQKYGCQLRIWRFPWKGGVVGNKKKK